MWDNQKEKKLLIINPINTRNAAATMFENEMIFEAWWHSQNWRWYNKSNRLWYLRLPFVSALVEVPFC